MNKYVLIAGCQRSGTTILASCLGRHPDINMMVESQTKDILKGIGKEYNGNKLCLYAQIRRTQRSSRFGNLVNRLVNFNSSYRLIRLFPSCQMSIQDYKNIGAKIIYIVRNKGDVISSMMKRAGFSRRLALSHYRKAVSEIGNDGMIIHYEKFVEDNETVLRDICDYLGLPFDERMLEGQKYNYYYEYKRKTGLQP